MIPHLHNYGFARPFASFWALSNWFKDIWPDPLDPEGSTSPPTWLPQPSCANRLQLCSSREGWEEALTGLAGQNELGFPENGSHPKVA